MAAGFELAWDEIEADWDDALGDGVVTGSVDEARFRVLSSIAGGRTATPPARTELEAFEVDALEAFLLGAGLSRLFGIQQLQDASFFVAARKIFEKAVSQDAYEEALEALARRYGAGGLGEGASIAEAWIYSGLVAPVFEQTRRRVYEFPLISGMNPFLEQVTRFDGRVRANHLALHGFVASIDWNGWSDEVLPPLGWVCRCRVRRISWREAFSRGWSTGEQFPVGTGKLMTFRSLGGADAGFPRHLFVQAA